MCRPSSAMRICTCDCSSPAATTLLIFSVWICALSRQAKPLPVICQRYMHVWCILSHKTRYGMVHALIPGLARGGLKLSDPPLSLRPFPHSPVALPSSDKKTQAVQRPR